MKKMIFALAALVLLSVSVNAQKLTAEALIKHSACRRFECFDDYILTKGYSFKSAEDQIEFNCSNIPRTAI